MYREIDPRKLDDNFFKMIGDRWMLLCAGDSDGFNMMTVSWGMSGILWGDPVAEVFVRPQRHTFGYIEKSEFFSLSVFPESEKKRIHGVCGSKSGRDTDKCAQAGLTPVFDGPAVFFDGAQSVFICRKIYSDTIKPERFLDPSIGKWYEKDWHTAYIGRIERLLVSDYRRAEDDYASGNS